MKASERTTVEDVNDKLVEVYEELLALLPASGVKFVPDKAPDHITVIEKASDKILDAMEALESILGN